MGSMWVDRVSTRRSRIDVGGSASIMDRRMQHTHSTLLTGGQFLLQYIWRYILITLFYYIMTFSSFINHDLINQIDKILLNLEICH